MNIDTEQGMKDAVAWQEAHIAFVKDGGTWIVPRSNTFITINHKDKRATFVSSANPEPTIVRVFKAMGWEVDE